MMGDQPLEALLQPVPVPEEIFPPPEINEVDPLAREPPPHVRPVGRVCSSPAPCQDGVGACLFCWTEVGTAAERKRKLLL